MAETILTPLPSSDQLRSSQLSIIREALYYSKELNISANRGQSNAVNW